MDVSHNASYYIKEELKIKVAKWDSTGAFDLKEKKPNIW
jgi:hypothetical protein